jgi:hypothetical protein
VNHQVFNAVVKYLRPLKHVLGLPLVFDALLRIETFVRNRKLLDYLDEIEIEVLSWQNTSISIHKFGGVQFNGSHRELGHIHGNGLLDVSLSRARKAALMERYPIKDHHVFKNSGWVSFLIQTEEDKQIAISLLRNAYECRTKIV